MESNNVSHFSKKVKKKKIILSKFELRIEFSDATVEERPTTIVYSTICHTFIDK